MAVRFVPHVSPETLRMSAILKVLRATGKRSSVHVFHGPACAMLVLAHSIDRIVECRLKRRDNLLDNSSDHFKCIS